MGYRKTTVEIDSEQLKWAEQVLGTHGIKETVNAALHEVNRKAALEAASSYVLNGGLHVPDEETWAAWREPRG
jgi:Arc/MetJ family transcription regulator